MNTFSKILVPIDGSAGSARAVEVAMELGRALGATIVLLEVIEEFGPLPGKYEAAPPGKDRTAWLAEERFAPLRDLLDAPDVSWTRRVEEGYPPETICEIAEQDGVDLIILGSRGLRAVGRFLVGSVSDRVVHHAPCSVLVAK